MVRNLGACPAIWLFDFLPRHHQVSGSPIRGRRHPPFSQHDTRLCILAGLSIVRFVAEHVGDEEGPLSSAPVPVFPDLRFRTGGRST